MRPTKITEADARASATRFANEYSESVFNNTLSTLRIIFPFVRQQNLQRFLTGC